MKSQCQQEGSGRGRPQLGPSGHQKCSDSAYTQLRPGWDRQHTARALQKTELCLLQGLGREPRAESGILFVLNDSDPDHRDQST